MQELVSNNQLKCENYLYIKAQLMSFECWHLDKLKQGPSWKMTCQYKRGLPISDIYHLLAAL